MDFVSQGVSGGLRRPPSIRTSCALLVVFALSVVALPKAGAAPAGRVTPPTAVTAKAHSSRPAPNQWLSGVFMNDTGFQTYQRSLEFGHWRGSPVRVVNDYDPNTTWRVLSKATRIVDTWSNQKKVLLSLSLPMFAAHGSLKVVASGYDNHYFVTLAHRLVHAGLDQTIIRLGWEFNERYQRWEVKDRASAKLFAKAWRQIVTSMRSVRGQHFTFDWCVYDAQVGYRHVAQAYPGNKYVDYIGDDVYDWDQAHPGESFSQRWDALVNGPTGLAWQAKFATKHHKQISFPEWALVQTPMLLRSGGDDDPAFIRHMWQWIRTHDVKYEAYFNSSLLGLVVYRINGPGAAFPSSAAVYRRLWSELAG